MNFPSPFLLRTSEFGLRLSRPALLLGFLLLLTGCSPGKNEAEVPEARVNGDTVIMATNSPQLAALTVERVGP